MPSASLRRVKALTDQRSGSFLLLQGLAVLESLLWLGLIFAAGLLLGLAETRGITRLSTDHLGPEGLAELPPSIRARLPEAPTIATMGGRVEQIDRTGLYPLVAAGRFSDNPIQRVGSRLLGGIVRAFRPLQDNEGALQTLLILATVLLLLATLLHRFRRSMAVGAAGRAVQRLRHQVHRQTYRLGQSSLPSQGVQPVIDLFTREINAIRDGLIADLEITPRAPTLALGLLVVASLISPILTVFILSLGGLIYLVSIPLNRARAEELDGAARESGLYLSLLHEDLGLIRTVRGYGIEGIDNRRFEEHLDRFQESDARRIRAESRQVSTSQLIAGAAMILAAGLLVYNVLVGRNSVAGIMVLTVSLLGLGIPLDAWLNRRELLARSDRASGEVIEFLDRKPELQMAVGARFLPPIQQKLTFDNIEIIAPSGRPLLSSFTAEVPAKSRVAIMGFDEEAKHAVACLIPRLIDPRSGRVKIDGIDLRDVTLESLRAQISLVLQADLVFSDSVLNNIGLGLESHGLPAIIEAAKLAHAHNFIQELPKGYETVIGPMGHPLAPDQAYRIALARAALHDPSIVVLEEPISPLDDEVKPMIDDTIDRLMPGRTLIVLPHRLSTIRKCDRVIVLHNGRVEALGPPRELHGLSKLFRHLQYVEFNQFATGEMEAGQMGQ